MAVSTCAIPHGTRFEQTSHDRPSIKETSWPRYRTLPGGQVTQDGSNSKSNRKLTELKHRITATKKRMRRKSTGPDSVAETIKWWKEQNQKLQDERGSKKAPAKGSKKWCMFGKGGPPEIVNCVHRGMRQRTWGKWVVEICEPNHGRRLWLGSFPTAVEAAHAYTIRRQRRCIAPKARINFSENFADANSGCTSMLLLLASRVPAATLERSNEKVETEVHEVNTEVNGDLGSVNVTCRTLDIIQFKESVLHKEWDQSYDYFNVEEVIEMIITELNADKKLKHMKNTRMEMMGLVFLHIRRMVMRSSRNNFILDVRKTLQPEAL